MNLVYNQFLQAFMAGTIDLSSDIFRLALFTKEYAPSIYDRYYYNSSDPTKSIIKYEIVDANAEKYKSSSKGYKQGGLLITLTRRGNDSEKVYFTGSSVVWESVTANFRYAVLYRVTDSLLISCYDFGSEQVCKNSRIALDWSNSYLLNIELDKYNSSKNYVRSIQSITYEKIVLDEETGETSDVPTLNIKMSDPGTEGKEVYSFNIYNEEVKEDIRAYVVSTADAEQSETSTNIVQNKAIPITNPIPSTAIEDLFKVTN